jgi:predicted transporter
MKELIDPHQAHLLMLGVLILAPVLGLAWGVASKRLPLGLAVGLLVGIGNYALWTVYNAITDKLGLDTVKNLLVNLGLFVFIGIAVGIGAGLYTARKQNAQGGDSGDVAGDRN